MRLIDADKLNAEMYHEAFETDTDLQKWESGCWIRYKMFENAMENAPTVDAVPMSVIEDIKADIRQIVDEETEHDKTWARGLHYALCIIDKHMKGDTDGRTEN